MLDRNSIAAVIGVLVAALTTVCAATAASVDISPDGTRVVTASEDKAASIWNAATGAEMIVLGEHQSMQVSSAAFSVDGTRIVTTSLLDRAARIWDAATGKEIAVLCGHEDIVNSAVFSPDGMRVVTASKDKTVRIWDAATGKEIAVLRGHQGSVNSAVFSPDGSRIVTASEDRTARIWDIVTGKETARIDLGRAADRRTVHKSHRALESRAISRRHPDRAASVVDLLEGTRAQTSQCR